MPSRLGGVDLEKLSWKGATTYIINGNIIIVITKNGNILEVIYNGQGMPYWIMNNIWPYMTYPIWLS